MERRFVLFLVLTLLLWTGFIGLRMFLAPPPPPVAKKQDEPEKKQNAAKENRENAEKAKATTAEAEEEDLPDPPGVAAATETTHRQGVMGSLDPKSPYKMLVAWDSRGAVVERAELVGYWSVEDHSGYLGHLALTDAKGGGAEVNLVGPGTPAASAQAEGQVKPGLLPGDVIQQIAGKPIDDAQSLERHLADRTRPGDIVELGVEREGFAQPLKFTATLTRRPLEIVRPESHTFELPNGNMQFLPVDPLSFLLTLDRVGGQSLKTGETEIKGLPSLRNLNWKVESEGEDFVEFSFTLDEDALARINVTGAIKIRKRYELAKSTRPGDKAHHVSLKVTIENLGDKPLQLAYRLDGPTGLPLEGWWYSTKLHPEWFAGAGARDVVWEQDDLGHRLIGTPRIFSDAKAAIEEQEPPVIPLLAGDQAAELRYSGVDAQFFAGVILPQANENGQPLKYRSAWALPVQDVTAIPKAEAKTTNVTVRLTTATATVEPGEGESLVHEYQLFLGPKDGDVLEAYGLDSLIEFGWPIFKYPAKLLQGLLAFLYSIVRNYGIAIILLTVIVRSCMVPFSLKQARSAAKMQELAPEMAKIKEKHPDDPMKQHAAMQELYKKHNFNPFGGCLLVFIQLPIFIGLYRCLSVDIDLRDASLIPGIAWASNLAGPDKLFYWKDWMIGFLADETGWLGPFFNILPLVTVALFLVQQKMFMPPATDEQTRMQQQMMTYMTVFMGVMFYKVPAGLCLYFITSSLWGICERKMLPKSKPKDGGSGTPAVPEAKPASPNGQAKPPSSKKKKQRQR